LILRPRPPDLYSRYNGSWLFIFSQPDKLRMPQVTIRRPFGELDFGRPTTECEPTATGA
jgi:hypothetical protein